MKTKNLLISFIILLICSCSGSNNNKGAENDSIPDSPKPEDNSTVVERTDTCGLIILYPNYSGFDLVCDKMPSKEDDSVLLCAEACFTGQLLKDFDHFNIAGDHVSGGKRYHGYSCKRNTGAFIYYNGKHQFLYKNYSDAMDIAAENGGAAFAQEMIIHNGEYVTAIRPDSNKNQFRALCEIDGKICVIESSGVLAYGDFKSALLQVNVTEALYLDMGGGWNYAWYRDGKNVKELHPKGHDYCTNWITFYK